MVKPKKLEGVSPRKKSDSLTIRLEPRIRYLLEIAARKQHRSISSFVEAAVCDALDRAPLDDKQTIGKAKDVWNVDRVHRLGKLANDYPELMTYEESVVWGLLVSNRAFWKQEPGKKIGWLDADLVNKHWDLLHAVARGEEAASKLPHVEETTS